MFSYFNKKSVETNGTVFLLLTRTMALLTTLISIRVLSRPNLSKNKYLTFILITCIADALYIGSLLSVTIVSRVYAATPANSRMSPTLSYVYMALTIFLSEYLTSCLAIFNILIEIFMTVQRICILCSNKYVLRRLDIRTASVISIFTSLIYYSPALFVHKIQKVAVSSHNATTFKVDKTEYGKSHVSTYVMNSLGLFRIFLVVVVLLLLNMVVIWKYRAFRAKKGILRGMSGRKGRCNAKKRTNRDSSANRHLTIMLITLTFVYIIGNLPHSIYYFVRITLSLKPPGLYLTSQIALYLSFMLKLPMYYSFNESFRLELDSCFKSKESKLVTSTAQSTL